MTVLTQAVPVRKEARREGRLAAISRRCVLGGAAVCAVSCILKGSGFVKIILKRKKKKKTSTSIFLW